MIGSLAAVLAASSASGVNIEGFVPDRVITYKQVGEVSLSLYTFLPEDWRAGDERPAVLWFHGGGWVGGSPTQMFPQSRYLSQRGVVAMSVEYRVGGRHHTTPFDAVEDAASALRWVRAHANELGIDPNRVGAGGASSGGHLAAILGNGRDGSAVAQPGAPSARPDLLLLFNPGLDLYDSERHQHRRSNPRYLDISPMHTINAETSPMFIIHAEGDQAIPVTEPRAYKQRADALGVRCDLHVYPGRHHGFFNYVGRKDDFASTMEITDRFLAEFGWVTGPPLISTRPLQPDVTPVE